MIPLKSVNFIVVIPHFKLGKKLWIILLEISTRLKS
jgi:hypothetical protein